MIFPGFVVAAFEPYFQAVQYTDEPLYKVYDARTPESPQSPPELFGADVSAVEAPPLLLYPETVRLVEVLQTPL